MIGIRKNSSANFNMFGDIDPRLGMVYFDFILFLKLNGVNETFITSMIRPKTGDSGIHALKRAIDVASSFSKSLGRRAMEYINNKYIYDPDRPNYKTIIFHVTSAAGDAGEHYHIQVMGS